MPPSSPRTRARSASSVAGAHVQRVGGLEHVDAVGRVEQRAHERCAGGRAGCRHPSSRRRGALPRHRRPRGSPADRTRSAAPVGDARVERGDIRADAARRHAEGIGERRRRRPVAASRHEQGAGGRSCLALVTGSPPRRAAVRWRVRVPVNHAAERSAIRRDRAPDRRGQLRALFRPGGKRRGCRLPAYFTRMATQRRRIDEDPRGLRCGCVEHVRRAARAPRRARRGPRLLRLRGHRAVAADRPRCRRRRARRARTSPMRIDASNGMPPSAARPSCCCRDDIFTDLDGTRTLALVRDAVGARRRGSPDAGRTADS